MKTGVISISSCQYNSCIGKFGNWESMHSEAQAKPALQFHSPLKNHLFFPVVLSSQMKDEQFFQLVSAVEWLQILQIINFTQNINFTQSTSNQSHRKKSILFLFLNPNNVVID